ncbi:MAG: hypothetical protein IPN90_13545 [Elusimicrobia bacterium]|nr:hypothetical protein [Elusimicrobiota bacterium]
MGARRTFWIWVGAGAFLLVLLAVWVFRASLSEQRRPTSSFGANGFGNPGSGLNAFPQSADPNTPSANPSRDPHVQETLRTINEINRINKMNQELREKTAKNPATIPAPPPPKKELPREEKEEKKP